MFKLLYTLFTSPLGLPIDPLWEYLILWCVGAITHEIAWQASSGGSWGSLEYWFTKAVAFLVIWMPLYIIIMVVKFIIEYWIWITAGAVIFAAVFAVWKLYRKSTRRTERN